MKEGCQPGLLGIRKTEKHNPLYIERDVDWGTTPSISSVRNDGNRSSWKFPAVTGHAVEVGEQLEEIVFGSGIVNRDLRPLSAHARETSQK